MYLPSRLTQYDKRLQLRERSSYDRQTQLLEQAMKEDDTEGETAYVHVGRREEREGVGYSLC